MNEHQRMYWSSFDVIAEPYRKQVVQLSVSMINQEWPTKTVTIPLIRPLTSFAETDTVPPLFQPLPCVTMQQLDDVTWIPVGDVENQ